MVQITYPQLHRQMFDIILPTAILPAWKQKRKNVDENLS